ELDQPAVESKTVLYHLVKNHCSLHVFHYLMDVDCHLVPVALETLRIDARIDHLPLARPIFAHSRVPVDEPSFNSIRPSDIRMHAGQASIDVAGVKGGVEIG